MKKTNSWEVDRNTREFKTVIKKINSGKDEEIAEGMFCRFHRDDQVSVLFSMNVLI